MGLDSRMHSWLGRRDNFKEYNFSYFCVLRCTFLSFGSTFCAAVMFLMKQISSRPLLNVRKHKNNFQLQKKSVLRELKHGNAVGIRPRHENNKTIDPLLEMWA